MPIWESRVLEVQDIDVFYGLVPALHGVRLAVNAGETVCLLGPNGAGKTTTVKSIIGLLRPRAGSIRLNERDITGMPPHNTVGLGLSLAPEGRLLFPIMSVEENLELGAYLRGKANRARNLERSLVLFPRLAERMAQRAATLSGGEQQMLAIGRGLMAEPRLLILDEPSLGLAPLLVEELFAFIKRLNGEGLAILLVEQNVGQSLAIADRAYVLENGAIRFQGTPGELLHNPELKRAYLGV